MAFHQNRIFSVTNSTVDPTIMQWRARERQDLEALIETTGVEATIIKTPHADYRWRILLPLLNTAGVMQTLACAIDYSNFKNAVAANPSSATRCLPCRTSGRLCSLFKSDPGRSARKEPGSKRRTLET